MPRNPPIVQSRTPSEVDPAETLRVLDALLAEGFVEPHPVIPGAYITTEKGEALFADPFLALARPFDVLGFLPLDGPRPPGPPRSESPEVA